jgi:RNA polymerase sigma factor (sigma-70 family)
VTFTELAVLAQRDPLWRDHHVRANAPLISHCVARWGRGIDRDEAEQTARIACIQALSTFDPSLGSWGTHARVRIHAELMRARHQGHVVSGLRRRGGSCTPEREEHRVAARNAASLDLVLPGGDTFGDIFAAEVESPEEIADANRQLAQMRRFIDRLIRLAHLTPREEAVIRARSRDVAQVDLARRQGVSRQRIEQIERMAERKLHIAVRRYALRWEAA